MIEKATKFLKEVRFEMTRVHWPSWKETRQATIVVIVFSLIASFFLGFVDMALSFVIKNLIGA